MSVNDSSRQPWSAIRRQEDLQPNDMQTHLQKLRKEASECEMISKLATNETKRVLFAKPAHHRVLADEAERAMKDAKGETF